jgi:hypothetical protein
MGIMFFAHAVVSFIIIGIQIEYKLSCIVVDLILSLLNYYAQADNTQHAAQTLEFFNGE